MVETVLYLIQYNKLLEPSFPTTLVTVIMILEENSSCE